MTIDARAVPGPVLEARSVDRCHGRTQALREVSLSVAAGETLAIMGPSGSGKSTLMHCLAGILTPDAGEVWFDGRRLDTLSDARRSELRRTAFGFVFQFGQLVPELTVTDNVALPLLLGRSGRRLAYQRAGGWLSRLELADLGGRRTGELSGGQAQRVAIARALATRPRVIFADEPTGALDSLTGEKVMELLVGLARQEGTTVIIVTHDARVAACAARDVAALRRAQDTYQGMPFVYTLAADAGGEAYFADASVVPHVTDEQAARCRAKDDPRLLVLDGATSSCLWGTDPDAIEPGIFGPAAQPRLARTDYVTNANGSPWLTNPKAPLTGYPRVFGDTRTERDLRTRVGLDMIAQRLAGGDGLGPAGFTLDTLWRTATGKRNLSAELLRPDLRALCRARPVMTASDGRRVNVRRACATLAAWDGRAGLDSRGAILWREFFLGLHRPQRGPDGEVVPPDSWWKVPFDPAHPLSTPRGLDIENPVVATALADAVQFFAAGDLPLTLTPGEAQRYGAVPVPGCTEGEGCFDRIRTGGPLGESGRYPDVGTGSSFLMAVELTPAGPRARTVLTYSLSANPASPHHTDQTVLFSRGGWVTERFSEAEIRAYPGVSTTSLR
ncbi:hypothetical protein Sru01_63940 [Sphaerisporangium rufum]|uniref:ABC transporter domain-containing protein n=1 Tax=Sphaerisporangium rufum TaxID=1381558 RepID=A0A919RCE2_9ACTN|nr:penicillin acylase family protein [Sphaerisporangium rufum]GII81412.1 hypothetical protein Sru01_63940 [Sphaerisporangium rufum]